MKIIQPSVDSLSNHSPFHTRKAPQFPAIPYRPFFISLLGDLENKARRIYIYFFRILTIPVLGVLYPPTLFITSQNSVSI